MGSTGFFSFLFHSLPLTSADLHISSSHFSTEQTMSGEWFCFCDLPKSADSLPDNKLIQGLSNFDSFHWLTTIRAITQDKKWSKSSDTWFCHGLFRSKGCAHTSPSTLFQGREQLQDLLLHSSCPQVTQHWHHTQEKHSMRACCSIQQLGSIRHSPMPGGWA